MSSHTGGMGSFGDLIAQMDQLGFFTGLLPFVITYTIFFFFLRKIAEGPMGLDEGDGNRADLFAALLSIAFAFFTSRFIMAHPYFQDFFSQFIGRFTVIAIGLLGLLVLLGFVGIDFEQRNSVGYILALLVVAAFAVSGGVSSILPLQSRNEIISSAAAFLSFTIETGLIFVFLIFGLLWWTMGSEDKEGPKNPFYYLFNAPEDESDGGGT